MADEPDTHRIDRTGEIIGRYRSKLRAGSADRRALAEKLEATEAKLAEATRVAAEHPLKVENDRLKGELRTDRHKAAFARLAKASGAKDKAIDHLYASSGWAADKDEPDEGAMGAAIAKLRTDADYAFDPADDDDDATTTTATPTPTTTVVGGGRGEKNDAKKSGMVITGAMLADPKFALNPDNKAAILDAAKNKRFRLPDRQSQ